MKNRTYVDINLLQSVPSSNLNRDDAGSPKTAQYGGVTRARVSSQAWKKAMRQYFIDHLEAKDLGTRTLELVSFVADKVQKLDDSITHTEAMDKSEKVINKAGLKTNPKSKKHPENDHKLKALFFVGNEQAQKLAQAVVDGETDKKVLQAILNDNPAIDISLFGRMAADDPTLNEDASAQVAHAVSTHAVRTEFDFFTATDDFSSKDNAGAGMLGTMEYNSSTLYRYANVAGHELVKQLGDPKKAAKAMALFIEAFVKSMPTGKSTTFANETLPSAIVVTVRNDRPVNLVNGFEEPVSSTNGYLEKSLNKLNKEFKQTNKFVNDPEFILTMGDPNLDKDNPESFKENDSFNELINKFVEQVTPLLSED
ncbi:type I-E CRISPR-associated protein Cas7/Cse4/CasC [Apilactobacillus micheneri]|uniref:Type I-E CRISPR-associated protein Cas7/Cse4/CasC n=1 Tax=Apilactobacillus micheneri TaxID=1899430 RepID=A0A9Q8INI6_9LACO|nr:type I-E CRISPR-associated protein Cas7/Cse4/CasC [Apilactobacillus micheneri]TPR39917.1 type I-E CRISPR-associated protein Cas7/Cse4/CasC [Apilactobacillus micheneri]TPR41732.1 type I-E CRISPR-associated protein Cas7/Cse4/CasC [Apilactobacillus micheneri]TPR44119.1 type I-E CRISPR-associated protein Cas7/Cse4/CasC [Apilactobacillus micheneri]TPR45743.1 type I-E CRISPR-associated protein Cas7/Cse4/CasC [Apilactobacillus micheneri]TPR51500.1 type I-E CRISPR-associated protein Cas7/Cse4/CasC 